MVISFTKTSYAKLSRCKKRAFWPYKLKFFLTLSSENVNIVIINIHGRDINCILTLPTNTNCYEFKTHSGCKNSAKSVCPHFCLSDWFLLAYYFIGSIGYPTDDLTWHCSDGKCSCPIGNGLCGIRILVIV